MRHTIIKNRPNGFRIATIILNEARILLSKEVRFGKTYYHLPGGGLELGESMEDCAMRELFEEFSIEIIIQKFVGIIDDPERMSFIFLAKHVSGDIKITEKEKKNEELDDLDAEWVDIEKLNTLKWIRDQYKDIIPNLIKNKDSDIPAYSFIGNEK